MRQQPNKKSTQKSQSKQNNSTVSASASTTITNSREQLLRTTIRKNYQSIEKLFHAVAHKNSTLASNDDFNFDQAIKELENKKSLFILKDINFGISAYPSLNKIMGKHTLLGLSCLRMKKNFVVSLLKAGVSSNVPNNKFSSPLSIAAKMGYEDIVDILIEAGANPNFVDDSGDATLHHAIDSTGERNVKIKIIRSLLKIPEIKINILDHHGNTPLQSAMLLNQITICYMLLDSGADSNYQDTNGNTPLHNLLFLWLSETQKTKTLQNSYEELMRCLLKKGAQIYLPNNANKDSGTMILSSRVKEFCSIVLTYSSNAKNRIYFLYSISKYFDISISNDTLYVPELDLSIDIHFHNQTEKNALLLILPLIAKRNISMAKLILQSLLKNGADPNFLFRLPSEYNSIKQKINDDDLLLMALEKTKQDASSSNSLQVSILGFYLTLGYYELISDILSAGGNSNIGLAAKTPLVMAISVRRIDLVKILLHHDANPRLLSHYKGNDLMVAEVTPLNAAVMIESLDIFNLLLTHYDEQYLDLGHEEYLNPLCNAMLLKNQVMLTALIEAGANFIVELSNTKFSTSMVKIEKALHSIFSLCHTMRPLIYFSPFQYSLNLGDPSSLFFCLQVIYKKLATKGLFQAKYSNTLELLEFKHLLSEMIRKILEPNFDFSYLEALIEFRNFILSEYNSDIFTLINYLPLLRAVWQSYNSAIISIHENELISSAKTILGSFNNINKNSIDSIHKEVKALGYYNAESEKYKKMYYLLNYFIQLKESKQFLQTQYSELLNFFYIVNQRDEAIKFIAQYDINPAEIFLYDHPKLTIESWLNENDISPYLDEKEETSITNETTTEVQNESMLKSSSLKSDSAVGSSCNTTGTQCSVEENTYPISARQYLLSRGFTTNEVNEFIQINKESKTSNSIKALHTMGKFGSLAKRSSPQSCWFHGKLSGIDTLLIRNSDPPFYLWLPHNYFSVEVETLFRKLVPKFGRTSGNITILEGNDLRKVTRTILVEQEPYELSLRYEYRDRSSERRLLLYQVNNLLIALDYLPHGFHTNVDVKSFLVSEKKIVSLDDYLPSDQAKLTFT